MALHKKRYTFEETYDNFTKNLFVADSNRISEEIKTVLAKAFSKIPKEIADWAWDKLVFISSSNFVAWCISKRSDFWTSRRGFIFLSDCLLKEPEERQIFIVAHEIAHMKLGHKTYYFGKEEEKEANDLAKKWLSG